MHNKRPHGGLVFTLYFDERTRGVLTRAHARIHTREHGERAGERASMRVRVSEHALSPSVPFVTSA